MLVGLPRFNYVGMKKGCFRPDRYLLQTVFAHSRRASRWRRFREERLGMIIQQLYLFRPTTETLSNSPSENRD